MESAACAEKTKLQSRSPGVAFTDWSRDQLSDKADAAKRNAASSQRLADALGAPGVKAPINFPSL